MTVLGVPLLVAAWLAEALHWYRQGRGMLLDGEGGIGAGANLGDAARWTLPGLLLWAVPWACSARRARAHGNTTIYTVEAEKGWYEQVANVDLVVFAWNRAAIRCYEKAGFREIGRRRGGRSAWAAGSTSSSWTRSPRSSPGRCSPALFPEHDNGDGRASGG